MEPTKIFDPSNRTPSFLSPNISAQCFSDENMMERKVTVDTKSTTTGMI